MDREGHVKPMTIGARLYRLENQVGHVDRKLDTVNQLLRILVQRQDDMARAQQGQWQSQVGITWKICSKCFLIIGHLGP